MLETPEERIMLLRAGFTGKMIEELYIKSKNFKIAGIPVSVGPVEYDSPPDKKTCMSCEGAAEHAYFCLV